MKTVLILFSYLNEIMQTLHNLISKTKYGYNNLRGFNKGLKVWFKNNDTFPNNVRIKNDTQKGSYTLAGGYGGKTVTLMLKGIDDNFDLTKFTKEFKQLNFSYWDYDHYTEYHKSLYIDNKKINLE